MALSASASKDMIASNVGVDVYPSGSAFRPKPAVFTQAKLPLDPPWTADSGLYLGVFFVIGSHRARQWIPLQAGS